MVSASPLLPAERTELATLLFTDHASLPALSELDARYPQRNLPPGAIVNRVAPSPTGFAHVGLIYTALINRRFATQTGGIFILRVEDTDSKREVPGATKTIIDALVSFELAPDEGYVPADNEEGFVERGEYGPYLQSRRKEIYRACAAHLVREGLAYPCFCTGEELDEMSNLQRACRERTGYHGRWAKWRDASLTKIKAALDEGRPFVIRLRAWGEYEKRISWKDGVKGAVALPENDLDAVILKSDGQSLYHLAHALDDHFMRISHVIRGDEWVSSVPLHLQIFQAFGWEPPHYSHLATIQKLEEVSEKDEETGETISRQSKRKLSKRKDPEANVYYYYELGFPHLSVIEYLLNLANSDFEDWRKANPDAPYQDFEVKFEKLSSAGALADMVKLSNISRDVIGRLSREGLYEGGLRWAQKFDPELAELIARDAAFTTAALNIERFGAKPSKRIATWQDLRGQLGWFFDSEFDKLGGFTYPERLSESDRKAVAQRFLQSFSVADTREEWFDKCKAIARDLGFAAEMKEFKKNPAQFKGSIVDITGVLRVALSGSPHTPDLYEVLQVLGPERTKTRLERA